METIQAFKPALGPREAAALKGAVASGWLGTGIYTRLFERKLADELGMPSALATNSGTAALHLALKALDLEGREVLTTPVTSVATNHAILYNRAVPVFCDVDPETGNIDPEKAEAACTRRTKAIVIVHLGQACDMSALLDLARRKRLKVIEDVCACHAVGGFYKTRPLGTMGDLSAFSFGRFKGLTTLDGGAVVYRRAADGRRLARLRRLGHGEEAGAMEEGPNGVVELGYHYRMNDLSAALGLSQLERRLALQSRVDAVWRRYSAGLADVSFLKLPEVRPYSRGVRAYASVAVLGGRRDALRAHLRRGGIQPNDTLFPNHLYRLYRPYRRRLPEAEAYCARTLHLPYYSGLSDAEIDRILDVIRRFKG